MPRDIRESSMAVSHKISVARAALPESGREGTSAGGRANGSVFAVAAGVSPPIGVVSLGLACEPLRAVAVGSLALSPSVRGKCGRVGGRKEA